VAAALAVPRLVPLLVVVALAALPVQLVLWELLILEVGVVDKINQMVSLAVQEL
jgi:hypothetical protein